MIPPSCFQDTGMETTGIPVFEVEGSAPRDQSDHRATFEQFNADDTNGAEACENWTETRKWRNIVLTCFVTFLVGINCTSITSVAQEINCEFDIQDITIPNSYWPVTAWNGGAAIVPMIVVPLLEQYGVRIGYIVCYVLFVIFVFPQAFAPNFATLVVTRFFAGSFAGILQDIMDGIIADLWPDARGRSLPVTLYVLALLEGVTFGPVFGGLVASTLDWGWIFYIQLIIYGSILPLLIFFLDETRQHGTNTVGDASSPSAKSMLYEALVRPTYLLLTEPVVFFFTLLSALSYGLVFISTQSVAQVYMSLYDWSEWQTGIVQASICIGEFIGFLACLIQNPVYHRRACTTADISNTSIPESRLYLSIPGSFIGLGGGLFWYGWASYSHVSWVLPSIGLGIIGFGSMTVMQAIMIYITDSYGSFAGSASAAVCFGENAFAAFLPLAALRMYTNLGFQWASSLLGFIAIALSFAPVILVWKGKSVRHRSQFMQGLALK